jgi:alkylation response protein AidB-like acyl-CoA dehydrogenase
MVEERNRMFDRDSDQELFEETTRRFLETEVPLTKLRGMAGTKAGYEPEYWRKGAELGWTSLVVPEEAGGGSVSGHGVLDLVLLAYEFGMHAAPGPLAPTNLVAAALGRWGSEHHRQTVLAGLLSGQQVAAWATAEPGENDALGTVTVEAKRDGSSVVLSGTKQPVEAGAEAADILVTAREGSGLSLYLVPRDTPGLTVTPLEGVDLTRRFARIELNAVNVPADAVVGEASGADEAVEWLSDLALVIQLAEMVGCMQWALDTTLEWAASRYSFGRPLASYQEIKHRFADMKTWLEASHGIVSDAAAAVEGDTPDRRELVSAAKYFTGTYGSELLQDCVQLHGGIGVTFDHDLHLFLRRLITGVPLHGSPAEHAARLGKITLSRVPAPDGGRR